MLQNTDTDRIFKCPAELLYNVSSTTAQILIHETLGLTLRLLIVNVTTNSQNKQNA